MWAAPPTSLAAHSAEPEEAPALARELPPKGSLGTGSQLEPSSRSLQVVCFLKDSNRTQAAVAGTEWQLCATVRAPAHSELLSMPFAKQDPAGKGERAEAHDGAHRPARDPRHLCACARGAAVTVTGTRTVATGTVGDACQLQGRGGVHFELPLRAQRSGQLCMASCQWHSRSICWHQAIYRWQKTCTADTQ